MQISVRLVRCKSVLTLISMALIIAGCETSTKRDCPAFFHPDYAMWGQQGVGETLVFTDQNGLSESFNVTEIERNAPFQTENFGSQESDVPCDLTVREVLVRQDLKETILKEFDHGEFSDRDISDEAFHLSIHIGEEESKFSDFILNLNRRDSVFGEARWVQSFYSEHEIGSILFQDVITEEIIDEQLLENPDQVSAIAIASGFGLVQYTRVNGSVFSRVP